MSFLGVWAILALSGWPANDQAVGQATAAPGSADLQSRRLDQDKLDELSNTTRKLLGEGKFADAIRPAEVNLAKRLLDAAGGLTRIVTLAPERDPGLRVTRLLVDSGVTVSAGHCDPNLDQLKAARRRDMNDVGVSPGTSCKL